MARKSAAATPAPEAPLARMVEKDPTPLHQNFATWLEQETGYTPDLKTVQLATALRMVFQKSDFNQQDLAARKAAQEAAAAERAQRAQEREAKKAEREAAQKEKAASKAASTEEAPKAAKPRGAAKKAAKSAVAVPEEETGVAEAADASVTSIKRPRRRTARKA